MINNSDRRISKLRWCAPQHTHPLATETQISPTFSTVPDLLP
jgi:hypothetical protein